MAADRQGFWSGLVLGVAGGAIAGLLLAPRPGRETRRLLRETADALPELIEDLAQELQLQAEHLSEDGLQRWETTLERLRAAAVAGIAASQQEHQTLLSSRYRNEADQN
jgi:gas vesicle protein